MADADKGWEALEQIDRALAGRPVRDPQALTGAMQCLTAFRDHCVERCRAEDGPRHRGPLERVNAVISIVTAGEFPIGEMPWDDLATAQSWLEAVLREEAAQ